MTVTLTMRRSLVYSAGHSASIAAAPQARKVASRAYAEATSPALNLNEEKVLGKTAILNRENTLRVLNNLITALIELRDLVDARDQEELTRLMQRLVEARILWAAEREQANWDLPRAEARPGAGMLGRLIGIRPKPKDQS